MNIDAVSVMNKIALVTSSSASGAVNTNEGKNEVDPTTQSAIPFFSDVETKRAVDEATGLIQNIVSNKITNQVIRKMPSDEYLHLLNLLDEITDGSINKQI